MMLALSACKEGVCDDMNLCYRFLDELVVFIKMHKQSEPVVIKTNDQLYPDKKGLSCWIALVESGIQMHTLSPKNFITLDIYSCRRFSRKRVLAFTKQYFEPKDIEEIFFILRGKKY